MITPQLRTAIDAAPLGNHLCGYREGHTVYECQKIFAVVGKGAKDCPAQRVCYASLYDKVEDQVLAGRSWRWRVHVDVDYGLDKPEPGACLY